MTAASRPAVGQRHAMLRFANDPTRRLSIRRGVLENRAGRDQGEVRVTIFVGIDWAEQHCSIPRG